MTTTVTPISEQYHAGGYILWEPENGMVTRDAIVIKSGVGIITAGTVLAALITGAATVTPAAAVSGSGGTVGNGSIGTVTADANAPAGVWKVLITNPSANAGTFEVIKPDGSIDGVGTVAVAYNGTINFTLADGSADWVEDDYILVTVSYATPAVKHVVFDPTATDGSQVASAILYSGYKDATSADRRATANTRGPMRINSGELVWGPGVTTTAQKTAALAALAVLGIQSTPSS